MLVWEKPSSHWSTQICLKHKAKGHGPRLSLRDWFIRISLEIHMDQRLSNSRKILIQTGIGPLSVFFCWCLFLRTHRIGQFNESWGPALRKLSEVNSVFAVFLGKNVINSGRFKSGVRERGGIRICLLVHCFSAPPDRQLYYHTNATSHSLLKQNLIARNNRLPVQCRRVASSRHFTVIPVAMRMSLPPFAYLLLP